MIKTLAENYTQILHCSWDDGKTAVETAFDEMVMGAVWALCEFPLLVRQESHSDLSLTALDDALNANLQEEGCFSGTENIEVCLGPSGWTVDKRIPSVLRTKDS